MIDLKDPSGFPSLVLGVFAVASVIVCGMSFVYAIDALPHYERCCGEEGETYSSPSALTMIASIVLFPITILAGFIMMLIAGKFLHIAVMIAILAGFVWSWMWVEGLKDREHAAAAKRLEASRRRARGIDK